MLTTESRNEVFQFTRSQQSETGGFYDRAGFPDLYYSLFGYFLILAAGTEPAQQPHSRRQTPTPSREVQLLHQYVKGQQGLPRNNLISRCCLAIIEKEAPGRSLRKILNLLAILKDFISGRGGMTRSYQYFMVLLAFDAYGLNNRFTRMVARLFLRKQEVMVEMSCPVVAATLVLKSELGIAVEPELRPLMEFFDHEQGFRAFQGAQTADLLSTAVALYAFKLSGADLRLVRPACLNLLEKNFDAGAFLAGNGDRERDTEYTFYGLMALGLLT